MRWLREFITLAAAVGSGMICRFARFRPPYCLAAAVITVMLFKADRIVHHRRENPWFKHQAPYDPSTKRVTEKTSSVREARRARVWGPSFEE
jgi:hypothetical protein